MTTPSADTKLARCVRLDGDEWHLYWTKVGDDHRILIPAEKLINLPVTIQSANGNWFAVEPLANGFTVGPFVFAEIHYPEAPAELIAAADAEEVTRQREIAEWQPPMSVVAGAVAVIRALFSEASLPHGSQEAMDYAGHPDRGQYRGFAALHDRCDANMLLPGAENFDASNDKQLQWMEEVMHEVTAYLILRHEGRVR